ARLILQSSRQAQRPRTGGHHHAVGAAQALLFAARAKAHVIVELAGHIGCTPAPKTLRLASTGTENDPEHEHADDLFHDPFPLCWHANRCFAWFIHKGKEHDVTTSARPDR